MKQSSKDLVKNIAISVGVISSLILFYGALGTIVSLSMLCAGEVVNTWMLWSLSPSMTLGILGILLANRLDEARTE